jgi:hypothetical protein
MPKRRRKNPPKGRPSGVAPEATKGGPTQRPPYIERSPGEYRYKDINHKARIARIAKGLKLPEPPTPLSPAWQDLVAYLKPFWGSPYEGEIWDLYKRFTRVDPKYQSDIEGAAACEGLAAQDWIAKSALAEVRRYVLSQPHLMAFFIARRNVAGQVGAEAQSATGKPFYKPKYFEQWNIGGELLRRNATNDGDTYVEGKVRRTPKEPAGGMGKRPVYWYSESDARKRWPDRFKTAEGERNRGDSKPPKP